MNNEINGKVWTFGDNIDTDLIIAARYWNSSDPEHLAKYVMEDSVITDFALQVKKGDIIVAGENFGCGSSREHAPQALKRWGIKAIIAESYSEIFFGNCVSLGMPCFKTVLPIVILRLGKTPLKDYLVTVAQS